MKFGPGIIDKNQFKHIFIWKLFPNNNTNFVVN